MTNIPDFDNLDEAVEYWETHDSAAHWDELETVSFDVDLPRNLLHPRLTVLAHRPDQCPESGQPLEATLIEYITLDVDRLIMIRDVPALRCAIEGRTYILEATLDKIDHLLELERTQQLTPSETLSIPVFSLKAA